MRLACVEGKGKGLLWELKLGRSWIGRSAHCDIVLSDPRVSRVHAEVILEGDSFVLYDRESRNGSYINDERITRRSFIPGDMIRLGDTTIKAIGENLTASINWQETNPYITSQISLDWLTTQIKDAISTSGMVARILSSPSNISPSPCL